MAEPDPYMIDDENPELTDAQIAAMRPAAEVLPPALYAALVANYKARQGRKAGGLDLKEPGSDGPHRDRDRQIQKKRSDTPNKNSSRPVPGFSEDTKLGAMRKKMGPSAKTRW